MSARVRIRVLATAIWAIAVLAATAAPLAQQGQPNPRAPQRLSHLRRGVNVSDWFSQLRDGRRYTDEQFATFTAGDLVLIRSMGFDHVRLCVDPAPLFRASQSDQIPVDQLAYLDKAMSMVLNAGLAVDLDIQASDDFKHRLATDDGFVERFVDFWRALARHYAPLDPDRVFFEVLNEPELSDAYRWYGIEATLTAAIRDAAPAHTIIATGAHYSADDDLVFLQPLRDDNVVYAFHFYEPFLFTHQGATWADNYWHYLKGVPYPSSPEAAERAAALVPDGVHRLAVVRYGASQWNASRVSLEISQVAAWAQRWNVPVICNEFGAYRANASPGDRATWLRDVREALARFGIGWALWDYSSGFGVVSRGADGRTVPDADTLHALGLAMPASGERLDGR